MTTPMDDDVMRLHDALIEIGSGPVPDPEWSWARMSAALPDRRAGLRERLGAWLRRPLILSFASLVMGTGGAYAAGFEPARNGVDWVLNQLPGISIGDDLRSEENDRSKVADEATDDSVDNTDGARGGPDAGSGADNERDGGDRDRDDRDRGDRDRGDDGDDDDGADREGDDDRDDEGDDDDGGRDGDDGDRDDDDDDDDDGEDDDGPSGSGSSGSSGSGSGDDDREEEVDDDRDADDEIELPDADDIDDEND